MQLLRKKIAAFHFLLVPVFFVWHIYNEYFGLIPFKYTGRYLLYYIAFSFALFLTGKLFFKKNNKAGVWATCLSCLFFFWGAGHDFIRKLPLPPLFSSYTFLGCLIFAAIIALFISLFKKTNSYFKITNYLAVVFAIFFVTEAIKSGYMFLTDVNSKNNLAYYNTPVSLHTTTSNESKPDIFFILLDEYASSVALKNYLNFDNSSIDSLLLANKFHLIRQSKSNYNSTPFSISSTFYLDYFNKDLGDSKTVPKELLQAQFTFFNNPLVQFLRKEGYTIHNNGRFDINGYPAQQEPLFNHNIDDAFFKETMLSRFQTEIGWHFMRKNSPAQLTPKEDRLVYQPLYTNLALLSKTLAQLKTQENDPKFVFTHVLMPHGSYLVNSKGEKRPFSPLDDTEPLRDSLYLDQLVYINKWLTSFVHQSNQSFTRPRVVIIAGDHGRRDNIPDRKSFVFEKQFMNLSAFYFSDNNYTSLYDSLSPVNNFRVVLNKYFNTSLPLLKDSCILIQ